MGTGVAPSIGLRVLAATKRSRSRSNSRSGSRRRGDLALLLAFDRCLSSLGGDGHGGSHSGARAAWCYRPRPREPVVLVLAIVVRACSHTCQPQDLQKRLWWECLTAG